MATMQLTPAQHAILAYAIEHTGGKIEWFPDNIKGGARTKVLEGLFNRAMITRDSTDWFVAAEGYDALGRARPTPATLHPDPEVEAAVSAAEANWAQEKQDAAKRLLKVGVEGKPRTRENSKQATVIQMLQRPEGATMNQICAAGAHGARHFCRGVQEETRTHHHLGKARGRRSHLPGRLNSRWGGGISTPPQNDS